MYKFFACLLAVAALCSTKAEAQEVLLSTIIAEETLGEWGEKVAEELEIQRTRAINEANIAAEQRIYQVELALSGLIDQLDEKAQANLVRVDLMTQRKIRAVGSMLEGLRAEPGRLANRLDVTARVSVQEACAGIVVCFESYSISFFERTVVDQSKLGSSHEVLVGGSALRDESQIDVFFKGEKLDPSLVVRSGTPNTIRVRIPASNLTMKDFELARDLVEIEVFREPSVLRQIGMFFGFVSREKLASAKMPILILPKFPARVAISRIEKVDKWTDCGDSCVRELRGQTNYRRISVHSLPLEKDYRLRDVEIWPRGRPGEGDDYSKRHLTHKDGYYMICKRPVEVERNRGRQVEMTCLDTAINRSCYWREAEPFWLNEDWRERQKMVDFNFSCAEFTRSSRDVFARLLLEKREDDFLETRMPLGLGDEGPSGAYSEYGPSRSQPFLSDDPGYRVLVTSTINPSVRVELTKGTPNASLGSVLAASSYIENNGPTKEIVVNLSPGRVVN